MDKPKYRIGSKIIGKPHVCLDGDWEESNTERYMKVKYAEYKFDTWWYFSDNSQLAIREPDIISEH